MKDNEKFSDIVKEIRALPEPDYDKTFGKETQNKIYQNILQYERVWKKKQKRRVRAKRMTLGLASAVAILLFIMFNGPLNQENSALNDDQPDQIQKGEENQPSDSEKDETTANDSGTAASNKIIYRNAEYGFSFSLPKGWEGYTVVTETWEGTNNQSELVESGPRLAIRHPDWTAENPRQDIPIMVFTIDQWAALEKGEYHIGAAPIQPSKLGENNNYVFALPARYNFAFPDGYKEVEDILKGDPLQPNNVESDSVEITQQLQPTLTKMDGGNSFQYVLKNSSQQAVTLTFDTSQEFNYIVWKKDAEGTMVYDYSEDQSFDNTPHKKTIAPGEELSYTIDLGQDYERQTYILEVYMTSNEPEEDSSTKFHQNLEFTIN
ncbi:BsuPI-related putative proteinase inhibitor [Aquibacillus salsiterrae]|uniref:Intracellular proteinase inhibitor BsuPI domain-containing protein n=1 Tax=Aquibacillus salsiterrae TaxID=2950439 RepID=A0A9X3WFW5_9BACI|nr:BsuPI-related putative proteinase inhibitor [Aquibacillus salsiterrae]MDC3418258.1 BsuPI-related putative proteinase inhibitor [Aquibacillus salsiterrae]